MSRGFKVGDKVVPKKVYKECGWTDPVLRSQLNRDGYLVVDCVQGACLEFKSKDGKNLTYYAARFDLYENKPTNETIKENTMEYTFKCDHSVLISIPRIARDLSEKHPVLLVETTGPDGEVLRSILIHESFARKLRTKSLYAAAQQITAREKPSVESFETFTVITFESSADAVGDFISILKKVNKSEYVKKVPCEVSVKEIKV